MSNERERELLSRLLASAFVDAPDETADSLLSRFGTLRRLLDCPRQALISLTGLSSDTALLLTTLPELARLTGLERFPAGTVIDRLDRAAALVGAMYTGVLRERFALIGLDAEHRLISRDYLTDGTLRETSLSLRKLMVALSAEGVRAAVICHNHPAGQPVFSADDVRSTGAVMDYMTIMDIALIDHLLVTPKGILSMRLSPVFPERRWLSTGRAGLRRDMWLASARQQITKGLTEE